MNFTIVKKTVTFLLLLFAVAQICDAKSVEWALRGVDAHGEFHYGLAVFPKKNADGSMQYGAVNTNGQVAIKPTYKWLNHFNKGMAVAETIEGQRAIINVNGNILYKTEGKIAPIDIDGAFLVTNGSQTGLFYESALILPVEYKYLWSLSGGAKVVGFTRHGEGQPTYYLNLVNGKTFSFAFNYGEYVICREADSKDLCYYDKDGRELDKSRYSVSSGGVEIFKDKTKELYGLRNKKTGVVIVRPIYNKNNFVQDIWLNDVVIVSTKEKGCVVYDKYGKPVIKGHYISSIAGGYVSMADNTNSIGLYSSTGKEILPKEYSIVYADFKTGAPWFHLISKKGNNALYNVETRQMYEGSFLFNDGMFYNFKDKFYINSFTGHKIDNGYESCNEFSEGLAVVKRRGSDYSDLIDRDGNVVLEGSKEVNIYGDKFSEGVLLAKDEQGYYGYIYNPLGHDGFNYKQTGYSNIMIDRWRDLGDKLFEAGEYYLAKDYYYRIMVNRPERLDAYKRYSMCLYRTGNYESALETLFMARDMFPSDGSINELIAKTEEEIKKQSDAAYKQEEYSYEERPSRTDIFINALTSFGNMLGAMAGGNTYSGSYSSDAGTTVSSGSSDYLSHYQMWENRASSCYNSLTNLGYDSTSKSGKKSGGVLGSMSGGNYVRQKQLLREAQRNMQKIRREAARNGVNIPQSKWETATVGY